MQKPQSVHCEFVADSSLSRCKSATLRAPSVTWRVKRAVLGVEKSRFKREYPTMSIVKKSHINQDKNKAKKESNERSRFKLCYGPVIFDMIIIDLHQKRDKKRIKSKKIAKSFAYEKYLVYLCIRFRF